MAERIFNTTKGEVKLVEKEVGNENWCDVYRDTDYLGDIPCSLCDCDEYIEEQVEELLDSVSDKSPDDARTCLRKVNQILKKARPDYKLLVEVNDEDDAYEIYIQKGKQKDLFTNCIETKDELEYELQGAVDTLLRPMYIVAYVGLSDNEQEANGFNETKLFQSKELADKHAKELVEREVSEHDDTSWKIDEDGRYIIMWAGGFEKVIIEVHEEYINYI